MEDNIYDYSPDLCPESGFSNEVFREDSLQQDSSETLEPNLPNLPLDLLLRIGEYLDPKDVCEGVCQTNRSLNGVFGERSYWHNRLRAECKEYYTFLEETGNLGSEAALRMRIRAWERINRNFRWKSSRMKEPYLGKESEQILGNFRCIEFGGNGDYLSFVARDRHCISVWNLHDLLADTCAPKLSVYHEHDQRITSLKSLGHQISSGAYDGTIRFRDLARLTGEPLLVLCCAGLVQDHVWKENLVVSGTRGGTLEAFDPRTGENPQVQEKVFAPSEVCFDFEIKLRDHDAIIAGWDSGVRKLKLFDFRYGQSVAGNEAGSWNVTMDLGDGQLWVGADKGKVFQYDPDTLDVLHDHTAELGHTANNGWIPEISYMEAVRSLVYSNGHLISGDLRQVKMHAMGKKPHLLWEEEIVFSELAFCEERCLLAAAVGHTPDQIKLFYPIKGC